MIFLDYLNTQLLNTTYFIVEVIIAVVLLVMLPYYKQRFFLVFALGTLSGAVGFLLLSFQGANIVIGYIISNLLIEIGLIIKSVAVMTMISKRFDTKLFGLIFMVWFALHIFYLLITPDTNMRIISINTFNSVVSIYMGIHVLVAARVNRSVILGFLSVIYWGLTACQLWRIFDAVYTPQIISIFQRNIVYKFVLLYMIFAAILRIFAMMIYQMKLRYSSERY